MQFKFKKRWSANNYLNLLGKERLIPMNRNYDMVFLRLNSRIMYFHLIDILEFHSYLSVKINNAIKILNLTCK